MGGDLSPNSMYQETKNRLQENLFKAISNIDIQERGGSNSGTPMNNMSANIAASFGKGPMNNNRGGGNSPRGKGNNNNNSFNNNFGGGNNNSGFGNNGFNNNNNNFNNKTSSGGLTCLVTS